MQKICNNSIRYQLMLILLSISIPCMSQDLIDNYQFPPSANWLKIKTEHYSIVVPKENEKEGQRVANLLEYVYNPISKTLNAKRKPFTLILSNQNVEANGYVMLAPRKAEWYNTPPQSGLLGTGEWYQLMAVHEGRHMVQYDKFNVGFTRLGSIFFGEWASSLFPNFTIPYWFWEGDAVVTETALTNSGRGRLPSFDMPLRTILLTDQKISYYKASLGSYRDFTPNRYLLGYHMVTYVRRNFPANTWSKVTDISAILSFLPPTFSLALLGYTKKGTVGTYKNAMNDLKEKWTKQLEEVKLKDFKTVKTKPKHCWTNYSFPQFINDSTILAQKYGFNHVYQLVKIDLSGKEKKLKEFMPVDLVRMNPIKNKVVWSESLPDIRWGNRNYGSVVCYDLISHKKKRITRKTRYFAPVLSHDGNRIAAVEFTTERKCAIVIIDAVTGTSIAHLPNPSNDFITTPSWSDNDSFIVFTHQGFHGKALSIQSSYNGMIQTVLPYGTEDIGQPLFYKNYIVYNSPFSGIDNIYAVNIMNHKKYQLVSAKFGAFNPGFNSDGSKMIFTNYNSLGDEIGMIAADTTVWVPLEEIKDGSIKYYKPLISQEQGKNIMQDSLIPKKTYESEKYSTGANLLNIHSWLFVPFTIITPYIVLQTISNDKLNSTCIIADISFELNQKMFGVGVEAAYAGLFPVFEIGIGSNDRGAYYMSPNQQDTLINVWNEKYFRFGTYIPLDFSRGVYSTHLTVGAEISYTGVSNKEIYEENFPSNGEFVPARFYMNFTNEKYGTRRDLHSPFAQSISINNRQTLLEGDYKGSILSAQGEFYFPGLWRHHSIKLSAAYEKQDPVNYIFASEFLFPRGFSYYFFNEFTKLSADYSLPLFYTHWNIGPLIYINLFKGTCFYDYGLGNSNGYKKEYKSAGATVTMEFIPLSLPFTFEFGVRSTYLIDQDKITVEPVLGLFF
jgi:hypothetical protein